MCDLQQWISQYLLDCQYQKGLDPKTIKAYRIDLAQFLELAGQKNFKFTRNEIMAYTSNISRKQSDAKLPVSKRFLATWSMKGWYRKIRFQNFGSN